MLRKFLTLATFFVAGLVAGTSHADTYLTARVDVNPAYGGTNFAPPDPDNGGKLFNLSAGVSYTNFTPDAANPTTAGSVTAVGMTFVPSFAHNNFTGNTGSNATSIIAIFALEGSFTGNLTGVPATTALSADFQGGRGAIRFYDIGNNGPLVNIADPSTWVPAGAVEIARLTLADRPTAIGQGPPGGIFTENPIGAIPSEVNTASATAGTVSATGDATVIFEVDPSLSPVQGTLFDFELAIQDLLAAGLISDPSEVTGQFLVDIQEQLQNGQNGILGNAADLDTLFALLLGSGTFGSATYDPTQLGLNGDVHQSIQIGGRLIPGVQITPAEVPEPASLVIWGALAAFGGGFGLRRKLKAKANS